MANKPIVDLLLNAGCKVPSGNPPPAFTKTLEGRGLPEQARMGRQAWVEAFYCAVLAFLPSVQLDAKRIEATFECIQSFMKAHPGLPLNEELHQRLQVEKWERYFPEPEDDEEGEAQAQADKGGGDGGKGPGEEWEDARPPPERFWAEGEGGQRFWGEGEGGVRFLGSYMVPMGVERVGSSMAT